MSDLLTRYITVKNKLTQYKAEENKLRLELLDELFPLASAGTHNLETNGLAIKASFGLTYSLDKEILAETELTEEELDCISYTPKLVLDKYKEIESEALDELITIKPSLPTITIKEAE